MIVKQDSYKIFHRKEKLKRRQCWAISRNYADMCVGFNRFRAQGTSQAIFHALCRSHLNVLSYTVRLLFPRPSFIGGFFNPSNGQNCSRTSVRCFDFCLTMFVHVRGLMHSFSVGKWIFVYCIELIWIDFVLFLFKYTNTIYGMLGSPNYGISIRFISNRERKKNIMQTKARRRCRSSVSNERKNATYVRSHLYIVWLNKMFQQMYTHKLYHLPINLIYWMHCFQYNIPPNMVFWSIDDWNRKK